MGKAILGTAMSLDGVVNDRNGDAIAREGISIPRLRAVFKGWVIAPDDAEYDEARVREAYPGATWDRLVAIRRRYDPTNLSRLNQNIPPATDGLGR